MGYLVGPPRSRWDQFKQAFEKVPWQKLRDQVEVKLLSQGPEVYVLAKSQGRREKERAIRRRVELRIEAHILVCFLAYCLSVTLRKRLQAHAPGLTSRAVLETLSGILMLDVHVPLADGRELVMPRHTQPEAEHRLVLEKLGWEWPPQPPPRIRRAQVPTSPKNPETNSKM